MEEGMSLPEVGRVVACSSCSVDQLLRGSKGVAGASAAGVFNPATPRGTRDGCRD